MWRWALGFGSLFLVAGITWAQPPLPVGEQFQVNTYTTNQQYQAAVAAKAEGDFVVVWSSLGSAGTDTSDLSIQARRFDSLGNAKGDAFQVNSYSTNRQNWPSVAVDADGDFVVVWGSTYSDGADSVRSVQGQRYDPSGALVGGQFEVNTYTTSDQKFPAVTYNKHGDFVVVWDSLGSAGTDNDWYSIQARRFDDVGVPMSDDHQINSFWVAHQTTPSVVSDPDGDFVVVWQSRGSYGDDTSHWSVQAQRYGLDGSFTGGQFQVNSYTTSHQYQPDVAIDGDGNFVVVWESNGSAGTDTDQWSIQAQRFDNSKSPVGSQFQVNSFTSGDQGKPVVTMDASGSFVVLWESAGSVGSDTSGISIQGQFFDANGDPVGSQFEVNSYTTGDQMSPDVSAIDQHGQFIVTWSSALSSGADPSQSVEAQRMATFGIFADGLESGGTTGWAAVVP